MKQPASLTTAPFGRSDFKRKEDYANRLYIIIHIFTVCSSIIFAQILRFTYFFLLERSSFSGGTIVKSVAIQQFKVCLSVLIFVWAVNHVKIDQLKKIECVFHGSNPSLYIKNCERMLDTFYRATSKS